METFDLLPPDSARRVVKVLVPAGLVYLVLRLAGIQNWLGNDAEGVGVLVQVIGTLFSVLYAFATYVIWGQYTAVESEIIKEAGALKDLIVFSAGLKTPEREPVLQAIRVYARGISETEWGQLANGERTERTDRQFSELISKVAAVKPQDDDERLVYERLLEIANRVSSHRDERLSLSVKRIPRTLILLVTLTAGVLVGLVFIFPFRSIVLGLASLVVTSLLLFLAHFVITDLDNPFAGIWNVTPEPFEHLVKEAR
jgi:VIT1/CCC1 family predicted Fe2+/Mn2+ transporter